MKKTLTPRYANELFLTFVTILGTGVWLLLLVLALMLFLPLVAAHGRDNGQWTGNPEIIRQWFQNLKQPDTPWQSCCGEADAFEADTFEIEGDHYVAIITDGRGVLATGSRIPVPNKKMKWDKGNPTGHGIIFLGAVTQRGEYPVYCYVTPGGV